MSDEAPRRWDSLTPRQIDDAVKRGAKGVKPPPSRRWPDGRPTAWAEDDGEPREPADRVGKAPARFYAPAGQCEFCDRRRAAAKVTMRGVRKRGGG